MFHLANPRTKAMIRSAPVSIRHLIRATGRPKVIAVLCAYLDESGISGSPTATIVGGLMAITTHGGPTGRG